MDFAEALARRPVILAEGAVIERLRRDPSVELDENVLHAGFVLTGSGRRSLAAIYNEYLEIGRCFGLPMILLTPTWRANPERLARAGLAGQDVNGEAVRFLKELRAGCGEYARQVWIGGLIGVRGDAYRPGDALPEAEAANFHRPQLESLAAAGADFLLAATLPAVGEAKGIARAMAATGHPYLPSFLIDGAGRLLDGTLLEVALGAIDREVAPAPTGYMINCVHHSALRSALAGLPAGARERLAGLQANTSAKSPEELDGLAELDTEPPEAFGRALAELHREYGLRILGGCCGSDGSHIRALAADLMGRTRKRPSPA